MTIKIRHAILSMFALTLPLSARAEPDPAITQVEKINSALLSIVKTQNIEARAATLDGTLKRIFNHTMMARYIVGPDWTKLNADDQGKISLALQKYLTMRFAHDFAHNELVQVTIDPNPTVRGADKLVRTVVTEPKQEPDHVDYRMRQYDGAWRVIDVYSNGVSDLAVQRADLASAFAKGGASGLTTKISSMTAQLAR